MTIDEYNNRIIDEIKLKRENTKLRLENETLKKENDKLKKEVDFINTPKFTLQAQYKKLEKSHQELYEEVKRLNKIKAEYEAYMECFKEIKKR